MPPCLIRSYYSRNSTNWSCFDSVGDFRLGLSWSESVHYFHRPRATCCRDPNVAKGCCTGLQSNQNSQFGFLPERSPTRAHSREAKKLSHWRCRNNLPPIPWIAGPSRTCIGLRMLGRVLRSLIRMVNNAAARRCSVAIVKASRPTARSRQPSHVWMSVMYATQS